MHTDTLVQEITAIKDVVFASRPFHDPDLMII